jgi:hypothetical protein
VGKAQTQLPVFLTKKKPGVFFKKLSGFKKETPIFFAVK